jgi:hypothetical protein
MLQKLLDNRALLLTSSRYAAALLSVYVGQIFVKSITTRRFRRLVLPCLSMFRLINNVLYFPLISIFYTESNSIKDAAQYWVEF